MTLLLFYFLTHFLCSLVAMRNNNYIIIKNSSRNLFYPVEHNINYGYNFINGKDNVFVLQPIRDRTYCRIEIWPASIANFDIPVITKCIVNSIPNVFWELKINTV